MTATPLEALAGADVPDQCGEEEQSGAEIDDVEHGYPSLFLILTL
jgi:hypothetical protein